MLPAGIRRLFRLPAPRVAADVEAELEFHLDERIAALVARGMHRDEAREQALRELGDLPSIRAALERLDRGAHARSRRRQWGNEWWLDVRHAVRSLRRTPGATLAVIVMLALGIGANAAMFDILDRLFLRAPAGVPRRWLCRL